jgi:hypothetical protein
VVLPPQDARGVIVLRVLAFRLGAVNVSGNKHFDTGNILASLPALKPDASPNLRELARNQALANEHPAKQVSVTTEVASARHRDYPNQLRSGEGLPKSGQLRAVMLWAPRGEHIARKAWRPHDWGGVRCGNPRRVARSERRTCSGMRSEPSGHRLRL